jgi:hypothetical protein
MSENHETTPSSPPISADDSKLKEWELREREYRERKKIALDGNKMVIFGALTAGGITKVVVTFDGYGDSGQIEDVCAYAGENGTDMPDERIEIYDVRWGGPEVERQTHTVHEAIEEICYALLEEMHDGWENNDGAFGDFTFSVEEETITLDYNEQYTESTNYMHEF